MLSVLKAKSSQEINVSFELKKSQSFHWSGHAPIFCSILLDPRFYFVPVEVPSGFAVHVEENLPGALEGLFSFGVSTLVSLDDSQHLPQLNFTDSALWTMTIWPLSVEEYDNQGFKVRKCKGGLETLFEFLLEGQGAPIHVLLHNEVTAKRHALFRSEHKMDPLTG